MYLQVLQVRLQSLQVQLQVANWLYKSRKWANEMQVRLRHLVNNNRIGFTKSTKHLQALTCICKYL